jgi:hypothetical protein
MKKSQKELAKELYFHTSQTFAQIAAYVNVDPKTLYRWAREDAWDKLRQAALAAPAVALDNFYTQILKLQTNIASRPVAEQFPTKEEADIARKLTLCITSLNKHLAIGMTMRIKRSFTDSIEENDYQQAMNLVRHSDEFFVDLKDKTQPMPWHNLAAAHLNPENKVGIQERATMNTDEKTQNPSSQTEQPIISFEEENSPIVQVENNVEMPETNFVSQSDNSHIGHSESLYERVMRKKEEAQKKRPTSGIFGHSSEETTGTKTNEWNDAAAPQVWQQYIQQVKGQKSRAA